MIIIEDLTKMYGPFTAVGDVSLTINRGEVFAFLGPNGSGKTTILKSIVGLNIPTSGRILVNGYDVRTEPIKVKVQISYLPQRVVFPESLSPREVVDFYARVRKIPREVVRATVNHGQFNGVVDKLVGNLSGGMIQRLALVVVILPDAPILLLDEPTANLDPEGVKRFRAFVLEQKQKGKTVVFSTHLLAEAQQLADRVGIFVSGRLAAVESVDGLQRTIEETNTIEDLYLTYAGTGSHEKPS